MHEISLKDFQHAFRSYEALCVLSDITCWCMPEVQPISRVVMFWTQHTKSAASTKAGQEREPTVAHTTELHHIKRSVALCA